MKRRVLALFVLALPAEAEAGGVLVLVPGQVGPYSPGQSVSVDVWLHNKGAFGVDLRLLALDVQGLRQRLFAGGDFLTSGGIMVNHVAKLNGGSWAPIDTGLDGPVYALQSCTLGHGTTLYAGGHVWGTSDWEATVHRLNAGWWSEIGRGTSGRTLSFRCVDDGLGQWLYTGGYLWDFEGSGAYGIVKWDGSEWSAMQGLNGSVRDMVIFDDGTGPTLYVAGNFPNPMPPNSNVALRGVAKWTGTGWAPLGGGMMAGYEEWAVNALAAFDDGTGPALYAAGDFRDVYLPDTDDLMLVNNIAKWDGLAWSPVGGGTAPNTAAPIYGMVVHDDGQGAALYVGGDFRSAGGVSVSNIARWDGVAWSDVGNGVVGEADAAVYALAVLDDGFGPALYAGGRFTSAGGVTVSNIAKWNGMNWSPVGTGFDETVRALAVHESTGDPNLIIEGQFEFDLSTLTDGGAMYALFPELPGPLFVYTGETPVPGGILHVPAGGSLRLGVMDVAIPSTRGTYRLDVASPYGPRGGSILAFGFGGPGDPEVTWASETGELTGAPVAFDVRAGPPANIPTLSQLGIVALTLLLATAATLVLGRHGRSATSGTPKRPGGYPFEIMTNSRCWRAVHTDDRDGSVGH